MKHTKLYLLAALAITLALAACNRDPHFLTDRQYRQQVHQDFLQRQTLAQGRAEALFDGMDTLCRTEREALEFLYAYMPYSDLADYDQAFYLQQVRTAFAARDTFSWGRQVPEDIFRHFVLVYRVNNENLDTARQLMFRELKGRIRDLTMEQAALEVNHWCHEHVAYRAADARTSAPLATMRTSLGRCGEESTFAVTALRSVGIPARQCYTPRWAHCDDNHAWVEVWVDGEWKFLGACEPDPELNMGWFAVPSTRCLMVHSKAFGRYHGDEEVVKQTALYSELNLLSHYAPTKHVTVTVCGMDDRPLEGVSVSFKMYNYAEYYTLATYTTDNKGQASLTTGLGDLLVWATDGTHYNYAKLDVRESDTLTLYLSREDGMEYVENLEIVPPVAGEAKVVPSEEAAAANAQRIAYEDSVRGVYMATFMCNRSRETWEVQPSANLTEAQLVEIITKSEGNWREITDFLNRHTESEEGLYLYDYLASYSDKDLRDISAAMLEHHLTRYDGNVPLEVWKKGLMPARISNELVREWRGLSPYSEPAVDDTGNYYNCPVSPMGVQQLGHCDAHSRDIYYVAACRAQGIPTYLDNATNTIYQWQEGTWQRQAETAASTGLSGNSGTLRLEYHGKDPQTPIYYPHFTLQKYEDGDFVTFDFEDDTRMATFPATLQLEPGYYCLSTGSRYPEGDVLNRMEFFTIGEGQQVTKEIVLRPLTDRSQSDKKAQVSAQMEVMDGIALAEYAGGTGVILAFMGSHREPAKHLVKEMLQRRADFKRWGGMTLVTTTDPNNGELRQLGNVDIIPMEQGIKDPLEKAVAKALQLERYEYPLVALVDKEGRILFHSTGYKIGLAELLLKATH